MLYLVATPIGNLEDISYRAVSILRSVDYILCEDTRHSITLLKHCNIEKPLRSYHQFNEAAKLDAILEDLENHQNIALISDAGTPGIADPGERLVAAARSRGIPVTAIPGPCAAIVALSSSGFATDRFQFCGFLPKKSGELERFLVDLLHYPGTTICYESPQRLLKTLQQLHTLASNRILGVARELTKRFEELRVGTAEELSSHWQKTPPKGEIVLLISGSPTQSDEKWQSLCPAEHVQWLQENYHLSKSEAIKMAARMRGCPKRDIYNKIQNNN